MAVFLLVRHGQNEYVSKGRLAGRLPGVHLDDKGKAQAKALADMLKSAPVKAVYSSPIDRTMETAQPIAEALGLEIIPREGLLEIDFGTWQDKTLKQLQRRKLWKVVQGKPSMMEFPEGETFANAQARVVKELITLSGKHKKDDLVVCVSHSDVIKLATAYFLGLPIDLFQRLTISTASITSIFIADHSARVFNINYSLNFELPQPGKTKDKKVKKGKS